MPHTVFETFKIQNSWYKIEKVSKGGFFELEMLEPSTRSFLLKTIIRTLSSL